MLLIGIEPILLIIQIDFESIASTNFAKEAKPLFLKKQFLTYFINNKKTRNHIILFIKTTKILIEFI